MQNSWVEAVDNRTSFEFCIPYTHGLAGKRIKREKGLEICPHNQAMSQTTWAYPRHLGASSRVWTWVLWGFVTEVITLVRSFSNFGPFAATQTQQRMVRKPRRRLWCQCAGPEAAITNDDLKPPWAVSCCGRCVKLWKSVTLQNSMSKSAPRSPSPNRNE